MLNLSSPYLIKKIIDFISKGSSDQPVSEGLTYVFILILTQSLYYVISEHLDFF